MELEFSIERCLLRESENAQIGEYGEDEIYSLVYFPKLERIVSCGHHRKIRVFCLKTYTLLKSIQEDELFSSSRIWKWDSTSILTIFEKEWKLMIRSMDTFEKKEIQMEEKDSSQNSFNRILRISNDEIFYIDCYSRMGIFSITQKRIVKRFICVSRSLRRNISMSLSHNYPKCLYLCNSEVLNELGNVELEKLAVKSPGRACSIIFNYETNQIKKVFEDSRLPVCRSFESFTIYAHSLYRNNENIEILVLSSSKGLSFFDTVTSDKIRHFNSDYGVRSSIVFNNQFLVIGCWYWHHGEDQTGIVEVFDLYAENTNPDEHNIRKLGSLRDIHTSGVSCLQVIRESPRNNSITLASGGYNRAIKICEIKNLPDFRLYTHTPSIEERDLMERLEYFLVERSNIFGMIEEEKRKFLISLKIYDLDTVRDVCKSLF